MEHRGVFAAGMDGDAYGEIADDQLFAGRSEGPLIREKHKPVGPRAGDFNVQTRSRPGVAHGGYEYKQKKSSHRESAAHLCLWKRPG
jgi:hypothetical protein